MLPEGVDPEMAHPRDRVGEVRLPVVLELLNEILRDDLPQYLLGVLRPQDLFAFKVTEQTVYPYAGGTPTFRCRSLLSSCTSLLT